MMLFFFFAVFFFIDLSHFPNATASIAPNPRGNHSNSRRDPSNSRGDPSNPRIRPSNPRIRPSNSRIRPSNSRIRPSNSRIRPSNSRIRPSNSRIRPSHKEISSPKSIEDDFLSTFIDNESRSFHTGPHGPLSRIPAAILTTLNSTLNSSINSFSNSYKFDASFEELEGCPFGLDDRLWTRRPEEFLPPNCSSIFSHSRPSQLGLHTWSPYHYHYDHSILDLVQNCTDLRGVFSFPSNAASDEEAAFPVAYIFVGERNAAQTLRLFRAIYWPQNAYCFTYDNESSSVYKEFMLSLASCFPNVQMNPSPVDVRWGEDNVLRNVMACFQPLLNSTIDWRYLQVVSYNDFPLKTNLELVKIMKVLNGSNDCDLTEPLSFYYLDTQAYSGSIKQKSIPPHGLVLFKGSYATTMTRQFVHFVLTNPISQKLYKWLEGTWCPEEHYWSTLIHNTALNAPGNFPGQCLWMYRGRKKPFLSRCQIWSWELMDGHQCMGRSTHGSCVYGVDDVQWLMNRPEFIAHKLYAEFQPAALYCLEKWHWNKVCTKSTKYFDQNLHLYEDLPAVRYQNAVEKDQFRC